jgi:hypothetical protein
MGKKVRSARGELVDFDLLKIKEQIAAAPPPTDVRARQDFIDRRLRRRMKVAKPVTPRAVSTRSKGNAVNVDSTLPKTEDLNETPRLIDLVEENNTPQPKKTRQRARPTKDTSDE